MPRPAGNQPPIAHPMYPENIRLYMDRKRRGNGVIEAQFKGPEGWSGYKVVGRQDMPAAMRVAVEIWVRMEAGVEPQQRKAGRPRTTPAKPDKAAQDTFARAAEQVMNQISAEQAKEEMRYGRDSKKLDKFKKQISQLKSALIPHFGDMRCCDIDDDTAYAFQSNYKNQNGTRPSASTMGNLGALFRRVLKHSAALGWRSRNGIPSLSKQGLAPAPRRPDVQPSEALKLMGFMTDQWCDEPDRQNARWDRTLLRAFVAVAIVTGSRPGTELTEMRWKHIRKPTKRYPYHVFTLNGKTGAREVTPDESLISFRDALNAARKINDGDPETKVFSRPNGVVPHDNFMRMFAELRQHPDLNITPLHGTIDVSLYSIRHYYATHLRRSGFTDFQIAEVMGTSPEMIHKHYGHVQPLETATRIANIATAKERRDAALTIATLHTVSGYKDQPPGPDEPEEEYEFRMDEKRMAREQTAKARRDQEQRPSDPSQAPQPDVSAADMDTVLELLEDDANLERSR